ncbi:flagellar hook-basal body complex protein FliE [Clostridium malenominatum]|uniref:Flagellar hook-basal body complex protein FliE n=2 Tax=Clostridium malenominatum TaxID=1539 RepID=A0ABP3U692_9CLOT
MKINEFIPRMKMFEEKNVHIKKEENNFLGLLKEQLDNVNNKQIQSEKSTEAFIKGEDIDIHEVTINAEEAKMSIELAVQVRNKIVEAYQELNRMQL